MTDDQARKAVLMAWAAGPQPTLLAPTVHGGEIWLSEVRALLPHLRRKPRILTPRNAETALRGFSGQMLVVVTYGDRGEEEHPDNTRLWAALDRILAWGRLSTWTEVLP